jgi:hypothetical protein
MNDRSQLEEVVKVIAQFDFPARWPGVLEKLLRFLASQSFKEMHGALTVLRLIVRQLA